MRLQDKHVPCPVLCPLCHEAYEDDWHVFFSCETSTLARQTAGLNNILDHRLQQGNSVRDIIHSICSFESKEVAGIFAMMLWVLWNNRNNMVWNDVSESGHNLGYKSRALWDEWKLVYQQKNSAGTPLQQQQNLRWEKPMFGWYKCNVDAAFHQELNKISTGWCLRDHMGRFILAGTSWMDGNCSIVEGEAIALIN
jgi:hypothetical protein